MFYDGPRGVYAGHVGFINVEGGRGGWEVSLSIDNHETGSSHDQEK